MRNAPSQASDALESLRAHYFISADPNPQTPPPTASFPAPAPESTGGLAEQRSTGQASTPVGTEPATLLRSFPPFLEQSGSAAMPPPQLLPFTGGAFREDVPPSQDGIGSLAMQPVSMMSFTDTGAQHTEASTAHTAWYTSMDLPMKIPSMLMNDECRASITSQAASIIVIYVFVRAEGGVLERYYPALGKCHCTW